MNTRRAFVNAVIAISMLLVLTRVQAQQDSATLYTPTGSYEIGVTSRQWVDESREEIYTADPNDHKGVTVWIWYPADVETGSEPAPYIEDPDQFWVLGAFAGDLGLTRSELGDYLLGMHLSAYQDAPIAEAQDKYPVVVYFDPLAGLPVNQGAQVQDLTSHGYIVVSILHGYGFDVAFGDQLIVGDAGFDYSFVGWMDNALPDVSFVIDQLEVLNREEQFAGRLDLGNIGLSGYSLGGSVAVMATAQDARIKATISQDGLPPLFDFGSITQPYLIFQSSEGDFEHAFEQFSGPTYLVATNQLLHISFSDMIIWPSKLDLPEDILDGVRGTQIINAYVIAFFDQYLKEEEQALLQGQSEDFPEVTLQSRNIDS
jgi:hypothetical protein